MVRIFYLLTCLSLFSSLSLSSHMSLSFISPSVVQLTLALNTSVHGPRPIRGFGEMFA